MIQGTLFTSNIVSNDGAQPWNSFFVTALLNSLHIPSSNAFYGPKLVLWYLRSNVISEIICVRSIWWGPISHSSLHASFVLSTYNTTSESKHRRRTSFPLFLTGLIIAWLEGVFHKTAYICWPHFLILAYSDWPPFEVPFPSSSAALNVLLSRFVYLFFSSFNSTLWRKSKEAEKSPPMEE